MTHTIYKYEIPGGMISSGAGAKDVEMHGNDAVIRHFGRDPNGMLCVWAEVESTAKTVVHRLWIVGTGDQIPEGTRHVMSCLDRRYVWHLFTQGAREQQ